MSVLPLALGICSVAAATSVLVALQRMPAQFRSLRTALRVSLPCLSAGHMRCDDHLACPCSCHDVVIHAAIATRWEDAFRPTVNKKVL
jgi:hypothetical protein